MAGSQNFFPMPGIQDEINRFKKMLSLSSGHVIIRGPRGVGKSYFVQLFNELYLTSTKNEPQTLNCAAVPVDLVSSELFGYEKGAFTGADKATSGFIKDGDDERTVLILEEFNSLSRADQAKLLVFLETAKFYSVGGRKAKTSRARIVATTNYETEKENRLDVIDRFGIIIEVPALSTRREDIFYYIGKKYPDLVMDSNTLMILYSTSFPGNFREVDRLIREYRAGFRNKTYDNDYVTKMQKVVGRLQGAGLDSNRWRLINKELFGGLLPMGSGLIGGIPARSLRIRLTNSDTEKNNVTGSFEVAEIVILENGIEHDIIDCRVVETIFNFFWGLENKYLDNSIYNLEPFNETVLLPVEYFKKKIEDGKLPEWESVFYFHKPTLPLVKELLTAIETICKFRLLHHSEMMDLAIETKVLSAEQVAEFLLDGDGDSKFKDVVLAIKKKIGHGYQTKVGNILGLTKQTASRWLKRWDI